MSMIIQPTLEIADEIAAGLSSGIYKRDGGVIRNASTGEIVKILKDTEIKNSISSTAPTIADAAAVSKKVGLSTGAKVGIGVLVVVGVSLATYGAYKLYAFVKKKNVKKKDTNALIGYNPEITEYLNAAQNKTMSFDKIVGVVKFFEMYSEGKNLNIEISNDELLALRNIFVKYAIALAKQNNIEYEPVLAIEVKSKKTEDLLEESLVALKFQREIFKN